MNAIHHAGAIGAVLLLGSASATAQITRDAGHVAVIEADSKTLSSVMLGPNGTACSKPGVVIEEVGKRFFQTHPTDAYDFLVVFTTFDYLMYPTSCTADATALHLPVSNQTSGIGLETLDRTASYGSASDGLLGAVHMNTIDRWMVPAGADSALHILAQEVGHQWMAYVQYDADRGPGVAPSDALKGRSNIHWSFYLHAPSATSSASPPKVSPMGGNYWSPDPGGGYRTLGELSGYSPLDLYLMGLMPPDGVPDFFLVDRPAGGPSASTNTQSDFLAPGSGAIPISVQDVISVEGPRSPAFGQAQRVFRLAFVLVTQQGVDATDAQIAAVDGIRAEWERYFDRETLQRGAAVTPLSGVAFVDRTATGTQQDGSQKRPFDAIAEARDAAPSGGTLIVREGSYEAPQSFVRPVTLRAVLGPVVLSR